MCSLSFSGDVFDEHAIRGEMQVRDGSGQRQRRLWVTRQRPNNGDRVHAPTGLGMADAPVRRIGHSTAWVVRLGLKGALRRAAPALDPDPHHQRKECQITSDRKTAKNCLTRGEVPVDRLSPNGVSVGFRQAQPTQA
jgi:hypothetical protein